MNPYASPTTGPDLHPFRFSWRRVLLILAVLPAVILLAYPLRVVVRWAGEPAFGSVEQRVNQQWIEDYNRRVDERAKESQPDE